MAHNNNDKDDKVWSCLYVASFEQRRAVQAQVAKVTSCSILA